MQNQKFWLSFAPFRKKGVTFKFFFCKILIAFIKRWTERDAAVSAVDCANTLAREHVQKCASARPFLDTLPDYLRLVPNFAFTAAAREAAALFSIKTHLLFIMHAT